MDADYRPDGSFVVWQTCTDGSTRIVEHGRWWVSAGRLCQAYTAFDSRPVRPGEQVAPARLTVARADQALVLVWPAGHLNSFRRATG